MNKCKNCESVFTEGELECIVCKYPLSGTDQEKAKFIAQQIIQKSDVEESLDKLKKARIILLVLGAFNIVAPFTPLFKTGDTIILYVSLVLGALFITFGLLTFKFPKIATLVPLIVISLYYLAVLIFTPLAFFKGMLWKLIIIMGLGYGYFSVRKADKILKENPYLAFKLGYGKIGDR